MNTVYAGPVFMLVSLKTNGPQLENIKAAFKKYAHGKVLKIKKNTEAVVIIFKDDSILRDDQLQRDIKREISHNFYPFNSRNYDIFFLNEYIIEIFKDIYYRLNLHFQKNNSSWLNRPNIGMRISNIKNISNEDIDFY